MPAPFTEPVKGTYVLILQLVVPNTLVIGQLGTFHFHAGWYAYVGSAFGAGGLRGRLKHHLSPVQKPHWHIDYLRQKASIEEVWYAASETVCEHEWAAILCMSSGTAITIPRFGASDCQCKTHLSHFVQKPDYSVFCELAGIPVQKWTATI